MPSYKKNHMSISRTLVAVALLCVIAISCCKRRDETNELEDKLGPRDLELHSKVGSRNLEESLKICKFSEDQMARGNLAMKQWKNDKVDPIPILIQAKILRREEGTLMLCLYYSDEECDVAGFGIREEHVVAGGNPFVVEETYPLFLGWTPSSVWFSGPIVEQRYENKQKDEKLWQEYMKTRGKTPKPPIFISLPDPNKVNVWIWLYDWAGNKSESLKLYIREETVDGHILGE